MPSTKIRPGATIRFGTIRLGTAAGFVTAGAVALALVSTGTAQAAGPTPVPLAPSSVAPSPVAPSLVAPSLVAPVAATPTPTTSATETPGPRSACTVNSYAPTSVVIGAAAVKRTFTADVSGCPDPTWAVGISAFNPLFAVDYAPTLTLSPAVLKNEYAGHDVPAVVYAKDVAEPANVISAELDTTFTLLRRATWGSTVNATPEPVKKGHTIKVVGTLTRVSWNQTSRPGYVGYTGRKVQLQFKATGTSSYVVVKTVKTTAGGKVTLKVPAVRTGHWRLVYPGGPNTAKATSRSDRVVVKQ